MEPLLAVNLVFNALLTFVIIITMSIFYEKRRTSLPVAVSLYSAGLLITSLTVVLGSMIDTLPFVLARIPLASAALFIVTLNYKSTARKTVAVICFMQFLLYAVEQFSFLIANIAADTLLTGELRPAIVMATLQAVISITTILIFWAKFKNIKKNLFNLPAFWILPLVLFLIADFSVVLFVIELPSIASALINSVLVLLCFVILYLHDTLSANYEEKLYSERQAQEKEYYYTQCRLMQESAEQVNAVRHDIKSHLATLKNFTAKGSMDDVKGYLNKLVDEIGKSEIYSNTGNIAFDSIINYKLRNAENENIKLDLSVAVPPEINIAVDDIVTVLGNLLDNALEAVAKVSEKFIKLDIEFIKGGLFAKIDNSFNGEIKYSPEKKEPASLKTGAEHGYGLKNIKQAVAKYNGHMKISHNEDVFSIGVFLYAKE